MFINFRESDSNRQYTAAVCIVGAGAAGITLARELAHAGVDVMLLESGGLDYERDTQALSGGEMAGQRLQALESCRIRMFGGTTHHWTGMCVPLDAMDFENRSWVPHSGWPISMRDMVEYYRKAQPILDLAEYGYDEGLWEVLSPNSSRIAFENFVDSFWQYSPPTRFGRKYRTELRTSSNPRVLLYANTIEVGLEPNGARVGDVQISTLDGRRGTVSADFVVLACGAIENARLLLLSDSVRSEGIGNQHDLVGRFFMEHPHVRVATAVTDTPEILLDQYSGYQRQGVRYRAGVKLSAQAQRRQEVLNAVTMLQGIEDEESGLGAARRLFNSYRFGRGAPDEVGEKVWRIAKDLDDVLEGAYRLLVEKRDPLPSTTELSLNIQSEQAPNPNSRVTLSDEKDSIGLRRAKLDWRLSPMDRRTIEVNVKLLASELSRQGLGRVRLDDWLVGDDQDWPGSLKGGCHHMGTTRMGPSAREGVVDEDCSVFGIDNLFIAGSSVFPTAGFANPTLTIAALALRLADHLKGKVSES